MQICTLSSSVEGLSIALADGSHRVAKFTATLRVTLFSQPCDPRCILARARCMVANSGLYTGLYTGVQAKNFLFDLYKACTAAVQARMNGNER